MIMCLQVLCVQVFIREFITDTIPGYFLFAAISDISHLAYSGDMRTGLYRAIQLFNLPVAHYTDKIFGVFIKSVISWFSCVQRKLFCGFSFLLLLPIHHGQVQVLHYYQ